MKSLTFFVVLLLPIAAFAQGRPGDFQIAKITKNLITSPQFTYTGAQQYNTNQRDMWLEVETTFAAAPEFTEELGFKYYVLFNGKLLSGEVTHVNIPAGRENRSVIYVPPSVLLRFNNYRTVTANNVQNITVQIVQGGAVKDEMSLVRAPAEWYKTIPPAGAALLNKNDTPFASLYWDRYVQIKPAK